MSIFLDPSIVPPAPLAPESRVLFPNTEKFIDRNTCPDVCETDDCAPLAYLAPPPSTQGPGCIIIQPNGLVVAPTAPAKTPSAAQLTNRLADNSYINDIALNQLNMGGANACVFKLLGVHQQGTLIDAAGFGTAIASDHVPDFPPSNAFDRFATHWVSDAAGAYLTQSWIGYDFGVVKRPNGLQQYSNEADAEARKHITSIAIKQAGTEQNWVSRARVERSDDGIRWFGVDVITIPQDTERNIIAVKMSVPSRMWRIHPITAGSDRWIVDTLELFEFVQTDIANIQESPLFQENRDRSYCVNPVKMKIYYDLIDINTELARFGIDLPSATLSLTTHFGETLRLLGRGFIIGDVIEIPSELQFTPDMKIVRKYVEISDVSWSTKGYTPGWTPLFQRITARPMLAKQETIDIVGSLEPNIGADGDGFNSLGTVFSTGPFQANENIQAAADSMTQQLGIDEQVIADLGELPQQQVDTAAAFGVNIAKLTTNYRDDETIRTGMPPAGTKPSMFTTADETAGYPENPKNNQYHRVTYASHTSEIIPPRLYRYSKAKNRWVYLETDERLTQQSNKASLKSYLVDVDRKPIEEI
jgi:hypothetical protein